MSGSAGEPIVVRGHNISVACVPFGHDFISSEGMLYKDNPLSHSFNLLLFQIAMVNIFSQAMYFLLRPLRQSKFVCSILGGIIIGPSVLGRNEKYMKLMFPGLQKLMLDFGCHLGMIYFVFIMMVKLDTSLGLSKTRYAWRIGATSILAPLAFILALLAAGVVKLLAIHYLLSFCITHFISVSTALYETNLLGSELGQLALSSSFISALIGWTAIVVLTIVQLGTDAAHAMKFCVAIAVFLLILFQVVRPVISWVIRNTLEGEPVKERYVVLILLGAFLMVGTGSILGGVFLGVVFYGLIIPNGPPLGSTLTDKTELFLNQFLMPIFYVYVGSNVDIYKMDLEKLRPALDTIVATMIFKHLLSLISCLCCKLGLRHAFVLSLLHDIKGVYEIILIHHIWQNKIIDDSMFSLMVLANTGVTAVTLPLIELLYKPQRIIDVHDILDVRTVHAASYSDELRILSCIHSEDNVYGIINLLEVSNPTRRPPICTYVVHLTELVGRIAPITAPYNSHKKMLRLYSTDHIMRAFENYARNSKGCLTVRPFKMIAPYRSMHEDICMLTRECFAHLIIVPFHKKQNDVKGSTNIWHLNRNLQLNAPCTVGILVDKGYSRFVGEEAAYNIGVIFFGGPDDREALALCKRAMDKADVNITVLRIHIDAYYEDCFEKNCDEMLLNEFKIHILTGVNATYEEVEANTSVEIIKMVRRFEEGYDLLVLGRRQRIESLFDEEMTNWVEHPELGVIGDMFASADFPGLNSVLVMQYGGLS